VSDGGTCGIGGTLAPSIRVSLRERSSAAIHAAQRRRTAPAHGREQRGADRSFSERRRDAVAGGGSPDASFSGDAEARYDVAQHPA
jgi:hypothetical protein